MEWMVGCGDCVGRTHPSERSLSVDVRTQLFSGPVQAKNGARRTVTGESVAKENVDLCTKTAWDRLVSEFDGRLTEELVARQ